MDSTRRNCLVAGFAALFGGAAAARAGAGESESSKAQASNAPPANAPPAKALPARTPAAPSVASFAGQRVIRVGPRGDVESPSIAAAMARDGDVVEIAAGTYRGDVAVWKQKRLSIRAAGGPVRLVADGRHAEGKAIWVLREGEFDISGIQFEGARVEGRNGAGIRFERGMLSIEDCRFIDNQNGILTSNDPESEIRVHRCQFSGMFEKPESGHYHNLYVGAIRRCHVSASYFSRAQVGHLLKSRARESHVVYNRLTDEDGRASYELEFPNGGRAVVMGNLIVQEAATENDNVVSYGAEGYRWPRNELLLAHNTVVNRRRLGATLVRVFPGPVLGLMQNNLFVGGDGFNGIVSGPGDGNVMLPDERQFADPAKFDFRLRPRAEFRGRAVESPSLGDVSLVPTEEYLHPMQTRPLAKGGPLSPGAFQS